jgi:hypothetical protein
MFYFRKLIKELQVLINQYLKYLIYYFQFINFIKAYLTLRKDCQSLLVFHCILY